MVQVDHDTYVNAGYSYNTSGTNGYYGVLETFTIPQDGSTITSVATHIYSDINTGTNNQLLKLNSNIFLAIGVRVVMDLLRCTPSSNGQTITRKWQNKFVADSNMKPDIVGLIRIPWLSIREKMHWFIQTFDIGTPDNTGPATSNFTTIPIISFRRAKRSGF